MKTIYLSPHLDDAVYSCGGLIWEQSQQGRKVEIWTIFAGDPPGEPLTGLAEELHQKWELGRDAVKIRRQEDREACQILDAAQRHFYYQDCIYRTAPAGEAYYQTEEDLFAGMDPRETELIDDLSARLAEELPRGVEIVVPLGIGNHVDHEITRKAASRLNRHLLYYADFPYAREGEGENILRFLKDSLEWQPLRFPVTEPGLEQWTRAALQYGSQFSTFWADEAQLSAEIREFSGFLEGMTLWNALEA